MTINIEKRRADTRKRVKRYRENQEIKAKISALQEQLPPALQKALQNQCNAEVLEARLPSQADVTERKVALTEIIRHPIETPITAGHKITAISELNKIEGAYPPERHAVLGEIRIRLVPVERSKQEAES